MALIKCSECGNEISEQATVCPKCGQPNVELGTQIIKKNNPINSKIIFIISFVVVLLGVIFLACNHKSPIEKIVYKDYRALKKEVGDNIYIEDAIYIKSTYKDKDENSETSYSVLIVYNQNASKHYAGFDSEDRYLGNGNEYVRNSSYDVETAINNTTVQIYGYFYEKYADGYNEIYGSSDNIYFVASEEEMEFFENCVVPVDVGKFD